MATNFDLLADSFAKYIVAPINAFGLGGFVFDVEGDSTVNHTAEITDHFVEDGSTIQDHMAIKPKRITLRNYVGELVYQNDDQTNTIAQKVTQKLTTLSAFLPALSAGATQAKTLIDAGRAGKLSLNSFSLEGIDKVVDYWALAKNLVGATQSRQQQAYQYLLALHENKIAVSVQTPFAFMTNMLIESIVGYQDEKTKHMSDFAVTMKEIRTAQVLSALPNSNSTSAAEPPEMVEKVAQQKAPLKTVGNVKGLGVKGTSDTIREIVNMPGFNYLSDADLNDLSGAPKAPVPLPPRGSLP